MITEYPFRWKYGEKIDEGREERTDEGSNYECLLKNKEEVEEEEEEEEEEE
jgi:hypothetical protein